MIKGQQSKELFSVYFCPDSLLEQGHQTEGLIILPKREVYYSVAVRQIRPYFGCRAEYRCCKKVSAVYGFRIATRLRNIGI